MAFSRGMHSVFTWPRRAVWLLVAAVFAVVVLAPLAAALAQVRPEHLADVLAEARQWRLLRNSLTIAAGSAVLAGALGFIPGMLLGRAGLQRGKWLAASLAMPLLLPPYVVAVAWIDLLGNRGLLARLFAIAPPDLPGAAPAQASIYNMGGVILVLALTYFPIVAGATAAAWRRVDGAAVEAALLHAGPRQAFFDVELRQALAGFCAGCAGVFLMALVSFSVPSLLQVQVYTVEVYARFSSLFESGAAIAQALPLLLIGIAVLAGAMLAGKRGHAARQQRRCFTPLPVWIVWSFWGYTLLLILIAAGLSVAVLVWRALPPSSLLTIWRSAADEIAASLLLGLISATIGAALALALAYVERWGGRRFFFLSALGFLVSGPVLGVGLIQLWNHPVIGVVYDSFAILVLACLARYLVFGHLGLRLALERMGTRPEEAAAACGVGPPRSAAGILLPMLRPQLFAVWVLFFILALQELDAALLVAPPGWTPLSVRVFSLMHYGPSQLVAALSLLNAFLILGAALAAAAALKLFRKWMPHA